MRQYDDNKKASSKKEQIEQQLSHNLTEGDFENKEAGEAAVQHLIPRYEIRIRTQKDPIAEETRIVREKFTKEDERYVEYMSMIEKNTGK
jgi:hypothetical protein